MMNRAMPEQVVIFSEDSSPDADDDVQECKQPNADYTMDQPSQKLTSDGNEKLCVAVEMQVRFGFICLCFTFQTFFPYSYY